MLIRLLKNQYGVSLIEVLIGSLILGVGIAGFMKMSGLNQNQLNTISESMEIMKHRNRIQSKLSREEICMNLIGGIGWNSLKDTESIFTQANEGANPVLEAIFPSKNKDFYFQSTFENSKTIFYCAPNWNKNVSGIYHYFYNHLEIFQADEMFDTNIHFDENLIFIIIMIVWFIIIIYFTKKRIKVKKKAKTEWGMLDIWAIGFVSGGIMFPIIIIAVFLNTISPRSGEIFFELFWIF